MKSSFTNFAKNTNQDWRYRMTKETIKVTYENSRNRYW